VIIESSCVGFADWQPGDTLSITDSARNNNPFDGFNSLNLEISEARSNNSLMRRICQSPSINVNYLTGRATYQYTAQNNSGEGTLNLNFTNQPALTVAINQDDYKRHKVYKPDRINGSIFLFADVGGASPSTIEFSILYTWRANGVIVQAPPNNSRELDSDTSRNTEYRVNILDFKTGRQASSAMVVLVHDSSGNPAPGDPIAAFTISGSNSQPTLDPSSSFGDIVRWEWDFNWHGEILEPFAQTINGANGTTQANYSNQPGKKYIRLRVTTASGNFHEIFQTHIVN